MKALVYAQQICNGKELSQEQINECLGFPLEELMIGSNIIREHYKGRQVKLCSIINAKSGLCSEDCRFCAQSGHYATSAPTYPLVDNEVMSQHAANAFSQGAHCFGVVTSGNRISGQELDRLCAWAQKRGAQGCISVSLGRLTAAEMRILKANGITKIHHNLETARSHFPSICTTHDYEERLGTIRTAKKEGFKVCSGGLFGLGETMAQRIELALELKAAGVDSVPLNFLNPVPNPPLGQQGITLTPREALTIVALFRYILPDKDISVCGGREVVLQDMQSWILHAGANGMMVGGYLTTSGRGVKDDHQMIRDAGFTIYGCSDE